MVKFGIELAIFIQFQNSYTRHYSYTVNTKFLEQKNTVPKFPKNGGLLGPLGK